MKKEYKQVDFCEKCQYEMSRKQGDVHRKTGHKIKRVYSVISRDKVK